MGSIRSFKCSLFMIMKPFSGKADLQKLKTVAVGTETVMILTVGQLIATKSS